MESKAVVIVGAGPAGLTLALSLAQFEIQSIILEKEDNVTEDPRGVFLAGDAVRILYHLGIGDQMKHIGHQVDNVNFHKSSFRNPPFFVLRTTIDHLHQTVPDGVLQVQPKLEQEMRAFVERSAFCDLRGSSTVVSREEIDDGVIVGYKDAEGTLRQVKCAWMIGADGKKGIVRKQFLEPITEIRQETGLFPYTGTWVAANLKIRLPTPETHPKFSLWKLEYTPEQVYDLFWPSGWHFCRPPGKATACGRFGPISDRLWRHEFAEPHWNSSMDATALLWEHLLPMITLSNDERGNLFHEGDVTFPKDCIEIQRCRPFTFCQKVVNKWFHNRIILIGDAAHVFPPFGGQGIACGIRDAHGLAWRLALLLRLPASNKVLMDTMLTAWAMERRQGVDDSTRITMSNSSLVNEPEAWSFYLIRKVMGFLSAIPLFPNLAPRSNEREGYKPTKSGFFLLEFGGGGKLAQVYLESLGRKRLLSDALLRRQRAIMTLLIITNNYLEAAREAQAALQASHVPQSILSDDSLMFLRPDKTRTRGSVDSTIQCYEMFHPVPEQDLDHGLIRRGYDEGSYIRRIGSQTKFAILRPDFIVFSLAKSTSELEQCLNLLKIRLGQ